MGGSVGLLAGIESGLAFGGLLGLAGGASVGALLARQLNHALPALGVIIGPAVTLTLMNLQRLTTTYSASLPPVTRRGDQPMDPALPSLPYVSTSIGVIRGDRRPLRASVRSLAWVVSGSRW